MQWPSDMGEDFPKIVAEELLEACRTFPTEIGSGWDLWHPRVIERLSYSTLLLLVTIMMECEQNRRVAVWGSSCAHCLIAQA